MTMIKRSEILIFEFQFPPNFTMLESNWVCSRGYRNCLEVAPDVVIKNNDGNGL